MFQIKTDLKGIFTNISGAYCIPMLVIIIDKPKVVSRSQSQKLTTWFSLKSQCPTTHPPPPPPPRESFKEAR